VGGWDKERGRKGGWLHGKVGRCGKGGMGCSDMGDREFWIKVRCKRGAGGYMAGWGWAEVDLNVRVRMHVTVGEVRVWGRCSGP
jgi:hypothetical protein